MLRVMNKIVKRLVLASLNRRIRQLERSVVLVERKLRSR
jgi:hypothetical protein